MPAPAQSALLPAHHPAPPVAEEEWKAEPEGPLLIACLLFLQGSQCSSGCNGDEPQIR
jgi:hypothetical protein